MNQDKKTEYSGIITTEKGKLPPQEIALEEAILGALLVDKKAILDVSEFLHSKVFYLPKHQLIYDAIIGLSSKSSNVDLLTVTHELKKTEKLDLVGGDFYLIRLTQKVASSAHIEFHARIVIQKYIQRELIRNSSAIIENCYKESTDVFELIDLAQNHINEVSLMVETKKEENFGKIVEKQIERGRAIFNGEIESGIQTPISRITNTIGGWRKGELIIIAARPGMGKTAFVLKNTNELIKQNIPVAFFSLEMTKEKLTERILSLESGIDGERFNRKGLSKEDEEKLEPIKAMYEIAPLYIDDTPSLPIQKMKAKVKRMKSEYDIQLIIVDYLQLMTDSSKKGNREQEISSISRKLKEIAKEIDVPVIALAQLSRSVETRGGNKRPLLSDLRESGAIEQDADIVSFIYRPDYYGYTEWDDEEHTPCQDQAEFIVAKNRNGGLLVTRMGWRGKTTEFFDLEQKKYEESFQYEKLTPVSPLDAFPKEDDIPF